MTSPSETQKFLCNNWLIVVNKVKVKEIWLFHFLNVFHSSCVAQNPIADCCITIAIEKNIFMVVEHHKNRPSLFVGQIQDYQSWL